MGEGDREAGWGGGTGKWDRGGQGNGGQREMGLGDRGTGKQDRGTGGGTGKRGRGTGKWDRRDREAG